MKVWFIPREIALQLWAYESKRYVLQNLIVGQAEGILTAKERNEKKKQAVTGPK